MHVGEVVNLMPYGAFVKLEDVKGKVATQSILPGEFIVAGRLTDKHGGSTLAAVVPEGKRAVTVRVNDVVGVAGFLLPGNRVDVIATAGGMTTSTILTLFVVPCVYAYMDRFSGWLRRDRDKHARMQGLEQES